MRWRPGIRRRRVLSREDPRFLIMRTLELKGKAERLSHEADQLYECAWELRRDRGGKAQHADARAVEDPRGEFSAKYFCAVPAGLGRFVWGGSSTDVLG